MTHHLILSLPPSWLECCLFFFQRVHCIAPGGQRFKECRENVDAIFIKDFANSIDVLVWKSFLFWNQISHFNDHVLFKSKCWNEIREMSVFEIIYFFEIQTSLVKDPTHYSMQSFDCLVSWKQKWPVISFKMTF